jgi:TorA maturation chaperone TorD
LAALAVKAGQENDAVSFGQLMAAQREFASQHLLLWGPTFSNLVTEKANTDFYRGIGRLTLGTLTAVAKLLQVEVKSKAFV